MLHLPDGIHSTVRDSSLSAAFQAIVAAEVGYLDVAYDRFSETADAAAAARDAPRTPPGRHPPRRHRDA